LVSSRHLPSPADVSASKRVLQVEQGTDKSEKAKQRMGSLKLLTLSTTLALSPEHFPIQTRSAHSLLWDDFHGLLHPNELQN